MQRFATWAFALVSNDATADVSQPAQAELMQVMNVLTTSQLLEGSSRPADIPVVIVDRHVVIPPVSHALPAAIMVKSHMHTRAVCETAAMVFACSGAGTASARLIWGVRGASAGASAA